MKTAIHRLHTGLLMAAMVGSPALAQDMSEGARLYQHHCATCHGLAAQGNGPMAPSLIVQPTDLTQLQARNDGEFPLLRVIGRIDGRDPLVSHGSEMPVYGDFFEGKGVAIKTPVGQPIMTSQPVIDLVSWLGSIQD